MAKFENVDILGTLEAILRQNTAFYQDDFGIDRERIEEAVKSKRAEDKMLLWMSRKAGTYCFRERDVFLKDTGSFHTWVYYGEQRHDQILAYAVELSGVEGGIIRGNIYELDYYKHFQHVLETALRVSVNHLFYENGTHDIPEKEYFNGDPDPMFGKFLRYEFQPENPNDLKDLLRKEQKIREKAVSKDIKAHISRLHDYRIQREVKRIVEEVRTTADENPEQTHFLAELSPGFIQLASQEDLEKLFAKLPYSARYFADGKGKVYASMTRNKRRKGSKKASRCAKIQD